MQFLARFEKRYELLGNLNLLACLGVAAHARVAFLNGEGTKTTQFNTVIVCQTLGNRAKNRIYDQIDVLKLKMRMLPHENGNQLRLGHANLPDTYNLTNKASNPAQRGQERKP